MKKKKPAEVDCSVGRNKDSLGTQAAKAISEEVGQREGQNGGKASRFYMTVSRVGI